MKWKIPELVDVCGVTYAIVFVGKRRMEKESAGGSLGCVDSDNAIIYLAKSLRDKPTLLRDTLIHEIVGHALLNTSGVSWWLRTETKKGSKSYYKFEEVLVRLYVPGIITTLRSLGLLKES